MKKKAFKLIKCRLLGHKIISAGHKIISGRLGVKDKYCHTCLMNSPAYKSLQTKVPITAELIRLEGIKNENN